MPGMPSIAFDRYYRYDELTELLKGFQTEFPGLVRMIEIGKSHEGRPIWLMEVTNFETGEPSTKPAYWCDGNIHASEVSASSAVLHILYTLVIKYGKDETITRALDSRAFYLVPRVNPDGAEWALADVPKIVRSSTRSWPYEEDDPYGLERRDLDGDGRILNMRVKDSNGPWKISNEEPRLMQRREPGETGGTYYRLMPEGLFHNFDGMSMRSQKIRQGLDMNRNFPNAWRMEHEQYGAGPYPTSEPEIRALVQAIVERPNICGATTYHTFSGVHLRPPGRHSEDELPPEDVWTFKDFGKKGEEITGYPAISVYHDFKYHPKEYISGVFDDWMYEHRGVFAWTTEIWSPQREAGITEYKYIDWFRDHPFEDDLKLLKWSDEKLGGKGHVDWYEFEHPQLGKVELGGWDSHFAFRNPPPQFLEAEISPFVDWVVWLALASPKLEKRETRVDKLSDGNVKVRFAVQNTGFLPTHVTELGNKKKLCRGVIGEIERVGELTPSLGAPLPSWLHSGKLRVDGGQLNGWVHVPSSGFGWQMNATEDVSVFEWVVAPGTYRLTARHERAGLVSEEITI